MLKRHVHHQIYRGLAVIGVLLFFAACGWMFVGAGPVAADPKHSPSALEAEIRLEGETVFFTGQITDQNVERFLEMVDDRQVALLVIASGGGEINAGMTMGEWIFDHGVDVVVDRMCMSSCANYIFTAGRGKTIRPGAIVAWHGNVLQSFDDQEAEVRAAVTEAYHRLPEADRANIDLDLLIAESVVQMQTYMARSKEKQAAFFEKIGVDEYICRIGKLYGAEDFFVLSVQDMARFGVRNVQAPQDYTATDLTPFRRTGKSVEFVVLGGERGRP